MGIRNGLEEAIFIINLKITSKKKERTLQNEVLQRPLCLHSVSCIVYTIQLFYVSTQNKKLKIYRTNAVFVCYIINLVFLWFDVDVNLFKNFLLVVLLELSLSFL